MVAALILSLGLHWTVLQSVAWMGMFIRYSQETSFAEAVAMTFDGRHPCKLCQQIAEGKRTEKQQDSNLPTKAKQLECSYVPVVFVFLAPTCFWTLDRPDRELSGLDFAPPTPPPKLICG